MCHALSRQFRFVRQAYRSVYYLNSSYHKLVLYIKNYEKEKKNNNENCCSPTFSAFSSSLSHSLSFSMYMYMFKNKLTRL